jgi:hypothetical protein
MLRHRISVVCVLLAAVVVSGIPLLQSVDARGAGASTVTESKTATSAVTDFLTEVASRISRDRIGPTKASRIYATINYGMFAASATKGDPLLSKINKPINVVDAGANIDPMTASMAAGTSIARQLFRLKSDKATYAELRDEILAELTAELDQETVRASLEHGLAVADAVVARSAADGFTESQKMEAPVAEAPGDWVPTAPGFQSPIDPGWGTLQPFFTASAECSLPAPPRDGSAESPYATAANEVAEVAKGLTDEQKAIARFWDDGRGRTGTPAGHWMMIALAAAQDKAMTGVDTVRMVAHTMMTAADGFIVNWREKYKWMVERPITALQRTDPNWASYIPTPAFPEYPSGHSTVSRVASEVLESYVGEWSFVDPGYGVTEQSRSQFEVTPRSFTSLREAAAEASISRLYGGIHYRFALDLGAELGSCVAENSLDLK